MTKRPLLFGVMAFVFGELAGLNGYMAMGLGMVTLLLLLWRIGNRRSSVAVMPAFFLPLCVCVLLGILNGFRCRVPDTFREWIQKYGEGDAVSCIIEGKVKRIENRENQTVLILRTEQIESISGTTNQAYTIRITNASRSGNSIGEEEAPIQIGNRIRCEVELRLPAMPTNPGEFNGSSYYRSRGIDFLGYTKEIQMIDHGYSRVFQWLVQMQRKAQTCFYETLSEENAGIMSAMLLGTNWELDSEVRKLFQRNGIAHILAISALHISIIGGVLYRILRKFGCSYACAGIPVMVVLLLYGWMTGFSGSTIRAILMFLLMLGGDILGRTYDMLTATGLACLLMLVENPMRLLDAGFLLSFSAVLALGAVVPFVQESFGALSKPGLSEVRNNAKFRHGFVRYLKTSLISGGVLQVVTAPIIVYFYYDFPVYGIFLNLIVIPLMTPVVLCGFCGLLLYPVWPWAGELVLLPCEWILRLFCLLCKAIENLPGAIWHIGAVCLWEIGLYYGMVFLILILLLRRRRVQTVLLCVLLICGIWFRGGGTLRIVMLDVGQGDGLLMETPGRHTILFDGGSSSRSKVGEYVLTPALKYYGTDCLDYVIVSHMDQDHVNGIMECIALSQNGGIPVRYLVVPAIAETDSSFLPLLETAKQASIPVLYMKPGNQLLLDGVTVTCLYPENSEWNGETKESESKNNRSMVLTVAYQEFHMLFTGDLEQEGEARLMQEQKALLEEEYTVLKVGHHGSSGSSSMTFLEQIQPKTALISCARHNSYGHPHAETLERLEHVGCQVLTTPEKGAVEIMTTGKTMKVKFFNAQTEGL